MRQWIADRLTAFSRKARLWVEELVFRMATRNPLPKYKLPDRRATKAALGLGWLAITTQALQNLALAAGGICPATVNPGPPPGCCTVPYAIFLCCATLAPFVCCQYQCIAYGVIDCSLGQPTVSCNGSFVAESLIAVTSGTSCTSSGQCLPINGGSSSIVATLIRHMRGSIH